MKRSNQYLRSWRRATRELQLLTGGRTDGCSGHKRARRDTEYTFEVYSDEDGSPVFDKMHSELTDLSATTNTPRATEGHEAGSPPHRRHPVSTKTARNTDDVRDILKLILTKMNTIEENQRRLIQVLAACPSENQVQDRLFLEPCTNQEEFKILETNLQDKAYFQQAVRFLSLIGGHKVGDATRRTMLAVANNAVWSGYSLYGKKQKAKLCQLRIYQLIKRAVKASLPDCTEKDVEVQIMEVLKHAPQKVRREAEAQRRTAVNVSDSD